LPEVHESSIGPSEITPSREKYNRYKSWSSPEDIPKDAACVDDLDES